MEEKGKLVYPATVKLVSEDGGDTFSFVAEAIDEKGCRVASRVLALRPTVDDLKNQAPGGEPTQAPTEPPRGDPGAQAGTNERPQTAGEPERAEG